MWTQGIITQYQKQDSPFLKKDGDMSMHTDGNLQRGISGACHEV